jgi:hypothetical protein
MIEFRCACGKPLQAQDEHAGLPVRCPGCGATVTVPGAPEAIQPTAPLPRAVAAAPSEQTTARPYAPAGPPPPRRERRPSSGLSGTVLAVIIGAAVTLVLLVVVGGYLLFRRSQDRVEEAAARTESMNNLKILLLGMHSYHDGYKRLPTHAIYSKDGRPLLSWRVTLLPFIEEKNLYLQFKLDEPWDSPHNIRLLERMPKIYAPVRGEAPPGHTPYQVFTGPNTVFNGPIPVRIGPGVPDGASNTIFIVEADGTVPWTQPADLVVAPGQPLPRLRGRWDDRFLVGMGDASVRSVSNRIRESVLRSAIDPRDGQPLPDDWDEPERP